MRFGANFELKSVDNSMTKKVLINGVDVARYVSGIKIEVQAGGVPSMLTLEMPVTDLDIDLPDSIVELVYGGEISDIDRSHMRLENAEQILHDIANYCVTDEFLPGMGVAKRHINVLLGDYANRGKAP